MFKKSLKAIFLISMILLNLQGCAMAHTMVYHIFSFDALDDSPDIEILDYQYGNSAEYEKTGQIGIHADRERVASGEIFKMGGVTGAIPRGDFLYVKWRKKDSGQITEKRVELKKLLPDDITGSTIHFAIIDSTLNVFLIPPPLMWHRGSIIRAHSDPSVSAFLRKYKIYPTE